ncbi:MAG: hypothetical protein SFV51_23905, partial [Bryobacteraceae bacterium]|nr:hypothetical protein [Bryobacteraceae bacterium]
GGKGPLDLAHYEEIGTMTNALDQHAEKAYAELTTPEARRVCELIFKALTDRGTDARGIRRPTTVKALCDLSGASVPELAGVIDVFRKPSRSFLMPPLPDALEPDTVVDISHESLMRVWKRLMRWVDDEADSASKYRRLAESAALYRDGKVLEMSDPELSLTLKWRQENRPTAAWAERYCPGFGLAETYLEKSRVKRDTEVRAAEERRRRELRTARTGAVLAVAIALAVIGVAAYILNQRSENALLKAALDDASRARIEAETARADERAARLKAEATADAALKAVAAQSEAETLAGLAKGSEQSAQRAKDDGRSQVAIQYEQKKDDAMRQAESKYQEVKATLAKLAAVSVGGILLSPGRMSSTDLFDFSTGAKVTATSGAVKEGGMFGAVNPTQVPDDSVTFFKDGEPAGFRHWITWQTPKQVTIGSVGLFARHDAPIDGYQLRRAMRSFKLLAREGKGWSEAAEYHPALPYGAGPDGTTLAVCLPVKRVTASEFRAEFVQAVDILGQYSAPRVVALDGYTSTNCTK